MPVSSKTNPHRVPPVRPARPQFRHYALAALGSVAIGATLPCLLVGLRCLNRSNLENAGSLINHAFTFLFAAMTVCGPGAIVLSVILFNNIESVAKKDYEKGDLTQPQVMQEGFLFGMVLSFFNLPGYLAIFLLQDDPFSLARVALLFATAGATCGMWVGWMAWRSFFPGERLLPRFSLRTLLLLVVLWGGVMLVFQPRQLPSPSVVNYKR